MQHSEKETEISKNLKSWLLETEINIGNSQIIF